MGIMKNPIFRRLSGVLAKIQRFLAPKQGIIVDTSTEVAGLKRELKILENQLHTTDNEKIELEKFLSDFHYRHTRELGSILMEILRLRMILYRVDQKKYEEAKRDEERYRKHIRIARKKPKHKLNGEEKKELKKRFRKATLLCHPDKVSEKLKEEAEKMFISLKKAYDLNDLKKVTEILTRLEKGHYFQSVSDTVLEKELLMAKIKKLRIRIKELEEEIESIKNSYTYKEIIAIDNWDVYFREMKVKLKKELEEIKKQIKLV